MPKMLRVCQFLPLTLSLTTISTAAGNSILCVVAFRIYIEELAAAGWTTVLATGSCGHLLPAPSTSQDQSTSVSE